MGVGGGGGMIAHPSWANYFKIMQFVLPETPLILTSKLEFSEDSHSPLYNS